MRTLNLGDNQLTGLIIRNCPNLHTLIVSHNKLTYLTIENCNKIEEIYASGNPDLKNLNFAHLANLKKLSCDNKQSEVAFSREEREEKAEKLKEEIITEAGLEEDKKLGKQKKTELPLTRRIRVKPLGKLSRNYSPSKVNWSFGGGTIGFGIEKNFIN
ncbi:MAG: hypothetical protein mread185_000562 [Mycoplasmataceae bacterium]|nr:MAG: hypothetical protein mread185_000562 [Mycoplasmataceae bacterium]